MNTPFQSAALRLLIQNTLKPLALWNQNAEELLLATCAQESLFGTYRTQGGGGPARGVFQDEGEDFNDLWANYLTYHPTLAQEVKKLNNDHQGTVDDLINNDPYAIAICRIHYLRAPGSLPDYRDLQAMWVYYKAHYNTPAGAATQLQFEMHYKKYVTDGHAQWP
jgi:hypothetical protein